MTAIVEDPLAEALLHARVTAGQVAVVDRLDDGTIEVHVLHKVQAIQVIRQEHMICLPKPPLQREPCF